MVHVLRYLIQGSERQKAHFVLQDMASQLLDQRRRDQAQPGKVCMCNISSYMCELVDYRFVGLSSFTVFVVSSNTTVHYQLIRSALCPSWRYLQVYLHNLHSLSLVGVSAQPVL
jgi:hypothetical protein